MRVGQLFKFLSNNGSHEYLVEKITDIEGEQISTVVIESSGGTIAGVGQEFIYSSLERMLDNPYFTITEITFKTYYKACKQ